jgi:hypothetical protein
MNLRKERICKILKMWICINWIKQCYTCYLYYSLMIVEIQLLPLSQSNLPSWPIHTLKKCINERENNTFTKAPLSCIGLFTFTINAEWKILNWEGCK